MLRHIGLWLHLLAVTVWVGSIFSWTLLLALWTSPKSGSGTAPSLVALGRTFYVAGWEALGLLAVTGLLNLLPRIRSGLLFEDPYLSSLLTKMGLLGGMIALQLWQHFGLLPQLKAAQPNDERWQYLRRVLLGTSGALLTLAAGAVWMGVQLHH